MSEDYPSTEGVKIDLIAMRNWHFKASIDPDRQPEMRRWHRRQWVAINIKYGLQPGPKIPVEKVAMVEMLTDSYRGQLHAKCQSDEPWDWKLKCLEAAVEIEKRTKEQD